MLNGFARFTELVPLLVGSTNMLDNATPSLGFVFTNRHHYYESLRPCAAHRYSLPYEVRSLGFLP